MSSILSQVNQDSSSVSSSSEGSSTPDNGEVPTTKSPAQLAQETEERTKVYMLIRSITYATWLLQSMKFPSLSLTESYPRDISTQGLRRLMYGLSSRLPYLQCGTNREIFVRVRYHSYKRLDDSKCLELAVVYTFSGCVWDVKKGQFTWYLQYCLLEAYFILHRFIPFTQTNNLSHFNNHRLEPRLLMLWRRLQTPLRI